MHLFKFAFYCTGALYALFVERALLLYFVLIVAAYFILSAVWPGAKSLSTRKKIMLGTWSEPGEGIITTRVAVRVEKVLELLETIPKQTRPTLTHYVIKGAAELCREVPDLNGRYAFGKFIPYNTIDIGCLVDIEGGKDLSVICLRDVGHMDVQEISNTIREKASKMKKSGGGQTHKKQTGPLKILPSVVVSVIIEVVAFLVNTLGISLKPFGFEKHYFGAAVVTSLGMLNFEDATAPHSGFTKCSFFVSANKVHEAPVVEDGKIVVGKVMIVNFAVDHRYVDGGKCKNLVGSFRRLFEHPEEYLTSADKKME